MLGSYDGVQQMVNRCKNANRGDPHCFGAPHVRRSYSLKSVPQCYLLIQCETVPRVAPSSNVFVACVYICAILSEALFWDVG